MSWLDEFKKPKGRYPRDENRKDETIRLLKIALPQVTPVVNKLLNDLRRELGFSISGPYMETVKSESASFYFSESRSGSFEHNGEREFYNVNISLGYSWYFRKGLLRKREGTFSLVIEANGSPYILFDPWNSDRWIDISDSRGFEYTLRECIKSKLRALSV